jgi:hypothetical protein
VKSPFGAISLSDIDIERLKQIVPIARLCVPTFVAMFLVRFKVRCLVLLKVQFGSRPAAKAQCPQIGQAGNEGLAKQLSTAKNSRIAAGNNVPTDPPEHRRAKTPRLVYIFSHTENSSTRTAPAIDRHDDGSHCRSDGG